MGVVHLAQDPQGGLVAIKVLHPNTTEDVNARAPRPYEAEALDIAPGV